MTGVQSDLILKIVSSKCTNRLIGQEESKDELKTISNTKSDCKYRSQLMKYKQFTTRDEGGTSATRQKRNDEYASVNWYAVVTEAPATPNANNRFGIRRSRGLNAHRRK